MDLWQKMMFPLRTLWFALSSHLKPPKNAAGLLKLHNDVESCGYEDVRVMWEMLRETEQVSNHTKRKQRPFWRL